MTTQSIEKSFKLALRDVLALVMVVSFLSAVVYFPIKWQKEENQRDCKASYATPACFERKTKEAQAKIEYEKRLEEIKNEYGVP